jgi:hypothetical protein
MSWDADLFDIDGDVIADWNYTHNTNGMANAVLYDDYKQKPVFQEVFDSDQARPSWWLVLDGMTAQDGAVLLSRIIDGLESDPEKFRAMNPPNKWGDYDSFVEVLREMRDKSKKKSAQSWRMSG